MMERLSKTEQRPRTRSTRLDSIRRNIELKLMSVVQTPSDGDRSKCLIRLHNCTPCDVIPFWLDFNGVAVEYPTLAPGAFINVDTYVSHPWFFVGLAAESRHNSRTAADGQPTTRCTPPSPFPVLAVPEETINLSWIDATFRQLSTKRSSTQLDYDYDGSTDNLQHPRPIIGQRKMMVCSLCKFILKSKPPTIVPCPHLTGEARFSYSRSRSLSDYCSSYLYSCYEDIHRGDHVKKRQNIYLVIPIETLKEKCFNTICRHNGAGTDFGNLQLPDSLVEEFILFARISTFKLAK